MNDWVPRVRFSLAGLMGMVAVIAIACAALRFASELWASALFTLALAIVCVAIIGTLCSRASARGFWAGGALACSFYLVMVFGPWCSTNVSPHLLTTKLLDYIYPSLHPPLPPGAGLLAAQVKVWDVATGQQLHPVTEGTGSVFSLAFSPHGKMLSSQNCASCHSIPTTAVGSAATVAVASREDFQRVGHSLLALLLALLSGLLTRYFCSARRSRSEPSGEQPCN
jgi:hypothetical protein